MKKEASYRFANITLLLSIMIVMIHSSCYRFLNGSQKATITIPHAIISTILQVAVPLFFGISAYLLYRNLSRKNIKDKMKRRIKSLVIPYLLWGCIFFAYYKIISMIPGIGQYAEIDMDLSINAFPKTLLWDGYFHTSWFIRNLIIYTAFCPIVFCINRITKNSLAVKLLFLALLVAATILLDVKYSNPLYFSAAYYIGIIASSHPETIERTKDVSKNKCIVAIVLFMAMTLAASTVNQDTWVFYIYRMLSIIVLACAFINSSLLMKKPSKLASVSFLLIVTHVAIIQIINKLLIGLFGINEISSYIYSIVSIIATIAIVYVVHFAINTIMPKILKILTGGR